MKGVKTFCIVAMDNIKGLDDDLNNLSVEPINMIKGPHNTALVATFKTELGLNRIKEVLNIGDRSFFISEMNHNTFTAHVDNAEIQKIMFSELDVEEETLNEITNDDDDDDLKDSYSEKELSSLDDEQRGLLMDKLLNNIDNLTVNQKEALSFLATL